MGQKSEVQTFEERGRNLSSSRERDGVCHTLLQTHDLSTKGPAQNAYPTDGLPWEVVYPLDSSVQPSTTTTTTTLHLLPPSTTGQHPAPGTSLRVGGSAIIPDRHHCAAATSERRLRPRPTFTRPQPRPHPQHTLRIAEHPLPSPASICWVISRVLRDSAHSTAASPKAGHSRPW